MIKVAFKPAAAKRPTDAATLMRTIRIPTMPSMNLLCTSAAAGLRRTVLKVTVVLPSASEA